MSKINYTAWIIAGVIGVICAIFGVAALLNPSPTPSTAGIVAIAQAEKTIKAADTKIASATVQVKHAKAVVKVKANAAAEKLAAYEAAKKKGVYPQITPINADSGNTIHKEGGGATPDLSVGFSPEGNIPSGAPENQSVKSVKSADDSPLIDAADEALDASHAEVIALQEEVASLEAVVDAHVEKEGALENERELLKAQSADLEKENARLESRLFWTHVAIGVAVVVATAGGLYLIGVF